MITTPEQENDTVGVDAIAERLDRISEVVLMALKPKLDETRAALRKDKTDAAIFDLTAGKWITSGLL